jgi:SAM-dependent methyltransferase
VTVDDSSKKDTSNYMTTTSDGGSSNGTPKGVSGVVSNLVSGATNGLATSLSAGAGLLLGSQVALRAGIWMQPRPMPHQQASWLDHPLRLRYRNPGDLLGIFGLYEGLHVADLGCGTGFFTVEMARRVGRTGMVHAVDLQEQMIAHTQQRIRAAGVGEQVRFHHSGIHSLPLPDDSLDLALMAAVLGEVPARTLALDEVRRVLKPGARLAITEELPDPAYAPAPLVRRWAEEAGFRFGGLTGTPFCYSMILFAEP